MSTSWKHERVTVTVILQFYSEREREGGRGREGGREGERESIAII